MFDTILIQKFMFNVIESIKPHKQIFRNIKSDVYITNDVINLIQS